MTPEERLEESYKKEKELQNTIKQLLKELVSLQNDIEMMEAILKMKKYKEMQKSDSSINY